MTTGVREGASTALKIEPPPGGQAAYYSYFVKQNIISRIVQLLLLWLSFTVNRDQIIQICIPLLYQEVAE